MPADFTAWSIREILDADMETALERAEFHDSAERKDIGGMYADLHRVAPGRRFVLAGLIADAEADVVEE